MRAVTIPCPANHVGWTPLLALAVACTLAAPTWAQVADPGSAGGGVAEVLPERPGLFRVGSFYLTPYLHVGTLGIDTNVFYTPTDRQTDFTASGGPGLEVVRPIGKLSRIRLDGGMDYVWFAKTEAQRRLNGYGSALLDLQGVRTRFALEERYATTFSRPSYEVNERVQQEAEGTQALLGRRLSERFALAIFGSRQHTVTDSTDYLGTDLGRTLTEDRYEAGGELRLALSVKTKLVGGGEQEWHRFPVAPERDGQSTLAYGGFRTDGTALISGQALGGARFFQLESGETRSAVYIDVDAAWAYSPKTKIGARFTRDLNYSALATTGETPTNVQLMGELYLDKMLTRTIYLRIFGRLGQLNSDGQVVIVTPEEGLVVAVRDDRIREAGAEFGYQFRPRVRIGVTARYSKRRSNIRTFGVDGLLAGLTVQYNPPQPTFR